MDYPTVFYLLSFSVIAMMMAVVLDNQTKSIQRSPVILLPVTLDSTAKSLNRGDCGEDQELFLVLIQTGFKVFLCVFSCNSWKKKGFLSEIGGYIFGQNS